MKTSFNVFRVSGHFLIITTLVTSMAIPFAAYATGVNPPAEVHPSGIAQADQALHKQNDCTKISSFGQQALSNISNRLAKVNSDSTADAAKRQQHEQTSDSKIAADRDHWDQVRDKNFAKLTADAKTDLQKQAVANFESTVLAAVATRRTAVDNARDTFRATVAKDVASRNAQVTQAIAKFTSAVNAAVAQAAADCATGTPATVRSTFLAALKQARQNLETALKSIPPLGPQVSQAAKIRTQAIAQADQAFQQAIQAAVATLKTALGQK